MACVRPATKILTLFGEVGSVVEAFGLIDVLLVFGVSAFDVVVARGDPFHGLPVAVSWPTCWD